MLSSGLRKAGPYAGNGATLQFPFSFKIFENSDLLVVQMDSTSLIETVQTLGTQYTVAMNANQDANPGGTVTMVTAPYAGSVLTIGSQIPYTQPMVLTNTGGFYPSTLNLNADWIVAQIQQLAEQLSRTFAVPFSTTTGQPSITTLGNYIATALGYSNNAAASATAAAASAASITTAAATAQTQANNAQAFAISASAAAATAVAPTGQALASFLDMFYPNPALVTTFTAIFTAGVSMDLGNVTYSQLSDETLNSIVNLSVGTNAYFDLGTTP